MRGNCQRCRWFVVTSGSLARAASPLRLRAHDELLSQAGTYTKAHHTLVLGCLGQHVGTLFAMGPCQGSRWSSKERHQASPEAPPTNAHPLVHLLPPASSSYGRRSGAQGDVQCGGPRARSGSQVHTRTILLITTSSLTRGREIDLALQGGS